MHLSPLLFSTCIHLIYKRTLRLEEVNWCVMFLNLLPEVQELILVHCMVVDLKNLKLVNSECHYILREHLSHTDRITEEVKDASQVERHKSAPHIFLQTRNTKTFLPQYKQVEQAGRIRFMQKH